MRRALCLAACLVAHFPALSAAVDQPIVRRLVVRSSASVEEGELLPLLAIRPGEPLTADRVRRTLRSLRLAGLASEVELLEEPMADGVAVDLVLHPDVRVDAVFVVGATEISPRKLSSELPQRRGQPLREDRVLRGLYRIEELYAEEGWRDASVQLEVVPAAQAGAVEVTYRVATGERTRVGEVRFDGLSGVAAAEAVAALKARPGEPLRPAAVREDAERLAHFLIRRDHRSAVVEPAIESPGAEPHRVDLLWRVVLGPRFQFEISGAERKTLEKRGLLPFLGDAGFDDALLTQAIADLRTYFQERGHYKVIVKESRSESPAEIRLRLDVEPGPRWELAEVRFTGNDSFSAERLQRLIATSPRRVIQLERGRLVDVELEEDLANLRSFYALEGFDRVRIGPARVEELPGRELAVVVPIVEGLRRTTATVAIEGLATVAAESLAVGLPLSANGPFHQLLLDASVETLRGRLEAEGYGAAIVEPELAWDASGTSANVTFRILEGERSIVESIVIRGTTRTATDVVRRFVALEPGEPISTARRLEVQRALYGLGIFSRVEVRSAVNDSDFAAREVIVEVDEGRPRSVAYGAGYDSESGVRGLLRFAHANLGGRAAAFQFDALVAQRDQLFRGVLRQPYLGRWPIETRLSAYRQAEDRPDFDVNRRGGQLGVERSFGRLRIGLFADYRIVELLTAASEEVVPRESRNARVASLAPTLLWDRRDDPVDPTRGWSATLQLERALPIASADADYVKLFAQWTAFRPIGFGTVAVALRSGLLEPRAASAVLNLRPIDAVPAAELFYAGGRTTHRAFGRDELGILGETLFLDELGDPLARGGGALALLNLEWRFPLVGALGGELFVDGGNVWREFADFDSADVRWGAGVGLRYASPIGPLRLEIGWKLDRQPFEGAYQAFVSLGNAF